MENSMKSSAINYGLYLGGAMAIVTVIIYALNVELLANMWLGIGLLLMAVAVGIVAAAKSKSLNEGFLSFKEAFSSYFITVVIGILISSVISYILFNIIDPEASKAIQDKIIENSISMMEGFGAPAEVIADQVAEMESQNQFSLGNILKGLAFQAVLYSVIGLIVSAIMKKSKQDA